MNGEDRIIIEDLLKNREDLKVDLLYKRDVNFVKEILSMPEWNQPKFNKLLTSSIWHASIETIRSVLKLPEWNDYKFRSLLTANIWHASIKSIKNVLEMKEWEDPKFKYLLTSNIWHSSYETIKEKLNLKYWKESKYDHLLVPSIFNIPTKNIVFGIELFKEYNIDGYTTNCCLRRNPEKQTRLLYNLLLRKVPLVEYDGISKYKLNPIFNISNSKLKKEHKIDLNIRESLNPKDYLYHGIIDYKHRSKTPDVLGKIYKSGYIMTRSSLEKTISASDFEYMKKHASYCAEDVISLSIHPTDKVTSIIIHARNKVIGNEDGFDYTLASGWNLIISKKILEEVPLLHDRVIMPNELIIGGNIPIDYIVGIGVHETRIMDFEILLDLYNDIINKNIKNTYPFDIRLLENGIEDNNNERIIRSHFQRKEALMRLLTENNISLPIFNVSTGKALKTRVEFDSLIKNLKIKRDKVNEITENDSLKNYIFSENNNKKNKILIK